MEMRDAGFEPGHSRSSNLDRSSSPDGTSWDRTRLAAHPVRDPNADPREATVREAARFVVSPHGQADDDRLGAAFQLLRAEAPAYWLDTPGLRPLWLLTRYADVVAVERKGAPFLAAPRGFLSSMVTEDRLRRLLGTPYVLRGLLQMDDPEHGDYRALTQNWFTPAALAALEPWLAYWAEDIVSRVAARAGPFDFVSEIAVPFAIRGIMRILGLPEADDALILKLSRGLVGPEDPLRRLAAHPTEAICRAGLGFRAYFNPVAADRLACPRDDLSSVIAHASLNGAPLPDHERFSYYTMIATGGHDTISFCLSGGMHALAENPDQLAKLQGDPGLIDVAVEEMLRWTTPGRHIIRTATEDVELGGQTIRAGEAVALFFGSANRDEAVFPDADRFLVDRRPNPHVAFGLGRHHCVGAHLARMEARALFRALLPRLARVELAGTPTRTWSTMVTGIASLPVQCEWRTRAA
jgi:cytochrome P450